MKRIAFLSALALVLATPLLAAQTPAPVQKAKFVPPIKGQGTIDVIRTPAKRVGNEIRTAIKVKNTSKGSLNLLKVEQYWYDKGSKNVGFGEYRHKKAPILPGEVVEFVVVAENNPKISHDALIFGNAYGKLHAREVKKFD